MTLEVKINIKKYKLMKAIVKILHPNAIDKEDMKIFQQSILDYELDEKSIFSWFKMHCAIEKYENMIAPPKNILDRSMSLEMGKYVTYIKEGVEFKILKNLNDVTWEVV